METKEKAKKQRLDSFFREDYCLGLMPKKEVKEPVRGAETQKSKEHKQKIELLYPEMYY